MQITDKIYLERILKTKKLELRELVTQHRVEIAVFNTKQKILNDSIDSIEQQLKENIL